MSGGRPSEEKRKEYAKKLKWLDLAKYKDIRDLSAPGWRDQLAFRRDLMDKTKFWIANRESDLPNPELEADVRWLFATIQENPLVDLDQLDERWPGGIHELPMLFFLRNTSSYHHLAVHATTVEEFYLAEAHSHPGRAQYARGFFDGLGDLCEDFLGGISIEEHFDSYERRYWEKWDAAHCPANIHLDYRNTEDELKYQLWMEEPIAQNPPDRLFLTVDASAPDARLEAEFKRVLAEYRASNARIEMPAISTDSWADAGLLPYIDIQLWAMLNDEPEVDPYAIRDAILPPWRRTDHTVRRVTQPAFERLMNGNREQFSLFVMKVAEDLLLWSQGEATSHSAAANQITDSGSKLSSQRK